MKPAGAAATTVMPPPRHRSFIPERWSVRCLVVLWRIVRQTLFRCSPRRCNRLRVGLLNLFGARVDRTAFVHPCVRIDRPWNLRIGSGSVVQHGVIIESMGLIAIGRRTHISQYAYLCSGSHDYRRRDMQVTTKPIHVGDEVWLASDVFVGPGVTIGDRVIVGARSTVFRDLSPDHIAAGNPARPLRPRPADKPAPAGGA
jgi:putative colanic acid biosynthesis acetyltransferase WcaF